MISYLNKRVWLTIAILSPLLLVAGNYGLKKMTSVYKTDLGNGVVIYADDYVRTGKWVFDCDYSRLVSRQPLNAPVEELSKIGKPAIGDMFTLTKVERLQAEAAIEVLLRTDRWYEKLSYLYSGLGESNDLNIHGFDLVSIHDDRPWAFQVWQYIDHNNRSSFTLTAEPYDPDTYQDYSKILKAASNSCPVAQ